MGADETGSDGRMAELAIQMKSKQRGDWGAFGRHDGGGGREKFAIVNDFFFVCLCVCVINQCIVKGVPIIRFLQCIHSKVSIAPLHFSLLFLLFLSSTPDVFFLCMCVFV